MFEGLYPHIGPLTRTTHDIESCGSLARAHGGAASSASFTWSAANTALFMPFSFRYGYRIRRAWWYGGSAINGTNVDVGIYNKEGVRIHSLGSTAGGTNSAINGAAVDWFVQPGSFFYAIVFSGTTNVALGNANVTAYMLRLGRCFQMASALPLPATATFATCTVVGLPLAGISNHPSYPI